MLLEDEREWSAITETNEMFLKGTPTPGSSATSVQRHLYNFLAIIEIPSFCSLPIMKAAVQLV